jgi:hypothetical protein
MPYFTVPPRCRSCGDVTILDRTSKSNRLGNAGRPYYVCSAEDCEAFCTFGDDRGIRDENPSCACGRPSRRVVTSRTPPQRVDRSKGPSQRVVRSRGPSQRADRSRGPSRRVVRSWRSDELGFRFTCATGACFFNVPGSHGGNQATIRFEDIQEWIDEGKA